jgi:hypothetical protein
LRHAMADDMIDAGEHRGAWTDVGTVERLSALDQELLARR